VQEGQEKTFSVGGEDYSVKVSDVTAEGSFEVEVNGEKIKSSMEGSSILVNGVLFEIDDIKKPNIFRQKYKIKVKAENSGEKKAKTEPETVSVKDKPIEEPSCSGTSATIFEGSSTAIVAGHSVEISYISSIETKLYVDGETTNALSEGESVALTNGDSLMVVDIMYVANSNPLTDVIDEEISKVEICVSDGSIINAHSCTADNICEIGSALIERLKAGTYQERPVLRVYAPANTIDTDELQVNAPAEFNYNVLVNAGLTAKGLKIFGGDSTEIAMNKFYVGTNQIINSLETTFENEVIVEGMIGTGNAYVCVSSGGKIYRSATACVKVIGSSTETDSQTASV